MAWVLKRQLVTLTTSANINKPFPFDDSMEVSAELLKERNSAPILVGPPKEGYSDVVARWPEKSAKFLLGLLKNAESNAEVVKR